MAALTELPLEQLSRDALAILRQIVLPIACGLSVAEIAKRLEITRSSVDLLLQLLRDEIEAAEPSSGATGAT